MSTHIPDQFVVRICGTEAVADRAEAYVNLTSWLNSTENPSSRITQLSAEFCNALCKDLETATDQLFTRAVDCATAITGQSSCLPACIQEQILKAIIQQCQDNTELIFLQLLGCIIKLPWGVHVAEVQSIVIKCSSAAMKSDMEQFLELGTKASCYGNIEGFDPVIWFQMFYPHLYHSQASVRMKTLKVLNQFLPYIPDTLVLVDEKFIDDLKEHHCKTMVMCMCGDQEDVLDVWCFLVRLLGTQLHHGAFLINPILEVVEKGFKGGSPAIRVKTFGAWQELTNNFALDREVIHNSKRMRLLMAPMMANNAKTEDIAIKKFQTWWNLIVKLKQPNFDTVVLPFLKYSFFSNPLTSPNSFTLCQKYSSTLGPFCADALAQLLCHLLPSYIELESQGYSPRVDQLQAPLSDDSGKFLKYRKEFIAAIKMVMQVLVPSNDEHAARVLVIWKYLLLHIRVAFEVQQLSLEVCSLLHLFYCLEVGMAPHRLDVQLKKRDVDLTIFKGQLEKKFRDPTVLTPCERQDQDEHGQVKELVTDLLKLLEHLACNVRIEQSKAQHVLKLTHEAAVGNFALPDDVMLTTVSMPAKTPVMFFVSLLLHRTLIPLYGIDEKYYSVFRPLVDLGVRQHERPLIFHSEALAKLETVQSDIQSIDLQILWDMWRCLATAMAERLKESLSNDENQLKEMTNFANVYDTLVFPIKYLLDRELRETQMVQLKDAWEKLCKPIVAIAHSKLMLDGPQVTELVYRLMKRHMGCLAIEESPLMMFLHLACVLNDLSSKSKRSKMKYKQGKGEGLALSQCLAFVVNASTKLMPRSEQLAGVAMTLTESLMVQANPEQMEYLIENVVGQIIITFKHTPMSPSHAARVESFCRMVCIKLGAYFSTRRNRDSLQQVTPLLQAGLTHQSKKVRQMVLQLWSVAFEGQVDLVTIPADLLKLLELGRAHTSEGPKKYRASRSTTQLALSKSATPLEDLDSQEFVPISTTPDNDKLALTRHQKEARKLRSFIPALYNDCTQDTQNSLPDTEDSLSIIPATQPEVHAAGIEDSLDLPAQELSQSILQPKQALTEKLIKNKSEKAVGQTDKTAIAFLPKDNIGSAATPTKRDVTLMQGEEENAKSLDGLVEKAFVPMENTLPPKSCDGKAVSVTGNRRVLKDKMGNALNVQSEAFLVHEEAEDTVQGQVGNNSSQREEVGKLTTSKDTSPKTLAQPVENKLGDVGPVQDMGENISVQTTQVDNETKTTSTSKDLTVTGLPKKKPGLPKKKPGLPKKKPGRRAKRNRVKSAPHPRPRQKSLPTIADGAVSDSEAISRRTLRSTKNKESRTSECQPLRLRSSVSASSAASLGKSSPERKKSCTATLDQWVTGSKPAEKTEISITSEASGGGECRLTDLEESGIKPPQTVNGHASLPVTTTRKRTRKNVDRYEDDADWIAGGNSQSVCTEGNSTDTDSEALPSRAQRKRQVPIRLREAQPFESSTTITETARNEASVMSRKDTKISDKSKRKGAKGWKSLRKTGDGVQETLPSDAQAMKTNSSDVTAALSDKLSPTRNNLASASDAMDTSTAIESKRKNTKGWKSLRKTADGVQETLPSDAQTMETNSSDVTAALSDKLSPTRNNLASASDAMDTSTAIESKRKSTKGWKSPRKTGENVQETHASAAQAMTTNSSDVTAALSDKLSPTRNNIASESDAMDTSTAIECKVTDSMNSEVKPECTSPSGTAESPKSASKSKTSQLSSPSSREVKPTQVLPGSPSTSQLSSPSSREKAKPTQVLLGSPSTSSTLIPAESGEASLFHFMRFSQALTGSSAKNKSRGAKILTMSKAKRETASLAAGPISAGDVSPDSMKEMKVSLTRIEDENGVDEVIRKDGQREASLPTQSLPRRHYPCSPSTPSVGILKKRPADWTSDASPTASKKKPRVSFADPPVSHALILKSVSRCLDMNSSVDEEVPPKVVHDIPVSSEDNAVVPEEASSTPDSSNVLPSQLLTLEEVTSLNREEVPIAEKVPTTSQERAVACTKMGPASIPPEPTAPSLSGITLASSPPDSSQDTPSISAEEPAALMDSQNAIYPPLVACKDPVEAVITQMTCSAMKYFVLKMMRGIGIMTIGDLSSVSEEKAMQIPVKAPRIKNIRIALSNYHKTITAKTKEKDPVEDQLARIHGEHMDIELSSNNAPSCVNAEVQAVVSCHSKLVQAVARSKEKAAQASATTSESSTQKNLPSLEEFMEKGQPLSESVVAILLSQPAPPQMLDHCLNDSPIPTIYDKLDGRIGMDEFSDFFKRFFQKDRMKEGIFKLLLEQYDNVTIMEELVKSMKATRGDHA